MIGLTSEWRQINRISHRWRQALAQDRQPKEYFGQIMLLMSSSMVHQVSHTWSKWSMSCRTRNSLITHSSVEAPSPTLTQIRPMDCPRPQLRILLWKNKVSLASDRDKSERTTTRATGQWQPRMVMASLGHPFARASLAAYPISTVLKGQTLQTIKLPTSHRATHAPGETKLNSR